MAFLSRYRIRETLSTEVVGLIWSQSQSSNWYMNLLELGHPVRGGTAFHEIVPICLGHSKLYIYRPHPALWESDSYLNFHPIR